MKKTPQTVLLIALFLLSFGCKPIEMEPEIKPVYHYDCCYNFDTLPEMTMAYIVSDWIDRIPGCQCHTNYLITYVDTIGNLRNELIKTNIRRDSMENIIELKNK